MKIDKIKQAIKINAKLVELGLDINSSQWDGFKFSLNEWGNLEIKSGKLDHKPFVSCKNEQSFEYYYLHETNDIIQEGDYFSEEPEKWDLVINPNCFGVKPIDTYEGLTIFKYRRKLFK